MVDDHGFGCADGGGGESLAYDSAFAAVLFFVDAVVRYGYGGEIGVGCVAGGFLRVAAFAVDVLDVYDKLWNEKE